VVDLRQHARMKLWKHCSCYGVDMGVRDSAANAAAFS